MVLYRKLNVLSASLNKTFPSIHPFIYLSIHLLPIHPIPMDRHIVVLRVCLYQDFCCTLNVVFLFCFVLCFIFRFCACLLLFCCCWVVIVCFVYVGVFFGGGGVKKNKTTTTIKPIYKIKNSCQVH